MYKRSTIRPEFQRFLHEYAMRCPEYRRKNCHVLVGWSTLARLEESLDASEIRKILQGPVREEIAPGHLVVFYRAAIIDAIQAFVDEYGGSPDDTASYAGLWKRLRGAIDRSWAGPPRGSGLDA